VAERCGCSGDPARVDVVVWSGVCQRADRGVRVCLHDPKHSPGNLHLRLSLRLEREGNTAFLPPTRHFRQPGIYRVGQKSNLLILSECVSKTEKIGGM